MNKFGAKKYNGFDSKAEYDRYVILRLMERAGKISDLRTQVRYNLIPSQHRDGKIIEKPCDYIADFVYEMDGKTVVEDVKGYKKGASYEYFVIKRKLMLLIHNIQVREV